MSVSAETSRKSKNDLTHAPPLVCVSGCDSIRRTYRGRAMSVSSRDIRFHHEQNPLFIINLQNTYLGGCHATIVFSTTGSPEVGQIDSGGADKRDYGSYCAFLDENVILSPVLV